MQRSTVTRLREKTSRDYNSLIPTDNVSINYADREFFVRELLHWYGQNKRSLPWRETREPYAIWVSEMMLQQTQVATVIPYWTRWMERFPTVESLATAPLDDVLKCWQGLGYYARARNLHKAAQVILEKHDGIFPVTYEEVLSLPGIGPYTAGAICSIALGLDTPIVDANVIRVLCRFFGIAGDPKTPLVQSKLWTLAKELIPTGRASDFNQGMMELGALLCQSRPDCPYCPMRSGCVAFASGTPEALPEFAAKPEFTTQTDVSAIVRHPGNGDRVLLVRRPEGGLWGGLYEFPRVTRSENETDGEAAERATLSIAGIVVKATDTVLGSVRHGVTTRKITLLGIECRVVNGDKFAPAEGFLAEWVPLSEVERFALSSPQVKLLEQIRASREQLSLFGD